MTVMSGAILLFPTRLHGVVIILCFVYGELGMKQMHNLGYYITRKFVVKESDWFMITLVLPILNFKFLLPTS